MVKHVKSAFGLGLVIVLASCGNQSEPVQPKIFSVNYTVASAQADTALVTKFLRNELTAAESRQLSPLQLDLCNFTMSFDESDTTVLAPQLRFFGAPSTSGFSVTVTDLRPRNLATTNDADCPELTAISMTMGANSNIALGDSISVTSSSVTVNGAEHRHDVPGSTQTFVFRSYDSATLYTTGALNLKLKSEDDAPTALYVDGTFALR